MNAGGKRILGLVMVVIAVASLLLSAAGLLGIWAARSAAIDAAESTASVVSDTLATTKSALAVAGQELTAARSVLSDTKDTALSVAKMITGSQPALLSVADLLEKDAPQAMTNVQTTLKSAQSTAKIIEDVLTALSNIKILGFSLPYKPDVTLNASLGNIMQSLDPLPGSFKQVGAQLRLVQKDLPATALSLTHMAGALDQAQAGLVDAQKVLAEYTVEVDQVQVLVQSALDSLPGALTAMALAVTFALLWLVVVQIMVLVKGLEWMRAAPAGAAS